MPASTPRRSSRSSATATATSPGCAGAISCEARTMPVINRIADFQAEMAAWRHDIHAHPETAFEERRTADIVARLLESFGIAVERGVATTGVIGTLAGSKPGGGSSCVRTIALRADMDALHVHEKTGVPHASTHAGRMHA